MQETRYNTTIRPSVGENFLSGIAYIVMPTDIDRNEYINLCYATNSVSIYSEHNGHHNRVPIDKYSLSFINFPKTVNEFGSPVSFSIDAVHNTPVVHGIFFGSDELCELEENQFKFKRKLNNTVVEVVGSSDRKYVGVNVITDEGGEFFVNVKSANSGGKINFNVDGDTVVNSKGKCAIIQFDSFTTISQSKTDEDEYTVREQGSTDDTSWNVNHNINTTNLTVAAPNNNFRSVETFKINDGKEPFILGKQWASFMKDLIKEIGSSTVTTMLGQMPLLNAEAIDEYQQKVDNLLSQICFLDK